MNTNTGEISKFFELEKELGKDMLKEGLANKLYVPIEEEDMTKKQVAEQKVSLKDHTSVLGKKLTEVRKERIVNNSDICPCGSEKKFKHCCQRIKKTERKW